MESVSVVNDSNASGDYSDFGSTSNNSGILQQVTASKQVFALSTAAVLLLATASAATIASYVGTSTTVAAGSTASCSSVHIQSGQDPYIVTSFHSTNSFNSSSGAIVNTNAFDAQGAHTSQAEAVVSGSFANFTTYYNTVGGQTTTSTQQNSTDTAYQSISITHSGSDPWTVSTTTVPGPNNTSKLAPAITDVSGTHVLTGSVTEADGTTISVANGQVTISEPLNSGGDVNTTFFVSTSTDDGDGKNYLGIDQYATSAAVMNGNAVSYALGSNTPILAMPCSNILDPGGSSPSTLTSTAGDTQSSQFSM